MRHIMGDFRFQATRKRDSKGPISCQHPDGCDRAWNWIRLHTGGKPDEFLCCAHAVEEYILDVEARNAYSVQAAQVNPELHKAVNQP